MVKNITIKNYKSLQQVSLNDCCQYNLLIGRPNVGKSNILEALSLFQMPYLAGWKINVQQVFRIDNASSLFFLGKVDDKIEVVVDDTMSLTATYHSKKAFDITIKDKTKQISARLFDMVPQEEIDGYPVFRTYNYASLREHDDDIELPFLCPITACNMSQMIKGNKQLYDYISELLSQDSLTLVFDTGRQEHVIMKKEDDDNRLILPLKALADSLLRLMYYKAAIISNNDAVLLMEEPESHTYPPYISKMVHDVLDSKDNQFFIATHSPYVVNEFLQEKADTAIFIVDAVDGRTTIKRLSNEEMSEVYEYGIDLFFNTESFLA